jgi:hypothetical protein
LGDTGINWNHKETECKTMEWIRMSQWLGPCEERTETLSSIKGGKYFDWLSIKLVNEYFFHRVNYIELFLKSAQTKLIIALHYFICYEFFWYVQRHAQI